MERGFDFSVDKSFLIDEISDLINEISDTREGVIELVFIKLEL